MNILYIWDSDYPWDVRVEKICSALRRNGYDVHIASRNLKKRAEYENIDGLHIHRLKCFENNKINYAVSFPAFFSPFWKRFLDTIIVRNKIKLLIARDLPLAITAIWAGERHRIPVIFDMAEDYLAMIWDIWRARKFSGFNLLVRNPHLTKLVERYAFKRFDHTIVVTDEAKKVVQRGGGDPERVTIVSNTPPLRMFSNGNIKMNNDLKLISSRFSAIYTGGIQLGRGLQTVFDAIPGVIKEIPDFLFVVVGDGYAASKLQKLIREKNLQDYVLWVGWVNYKRIFDYIRVSKVGLIPHFVGDHVNTTIPNKIFDYMGVGLPVIASDAAPMKRILTSEKCGLSFKSGDARDLTNAILKIYKSDIDYGENGIRAVRTKYNWSIDELNLLEVVGLVCHDHQKYLNKVSMP